MLLSLIKNANIGNTKAKQIYIGSKLVWQSNWTPSQISTVFWYDASDISKITATGNQVTQVLDKSGNNRTLTRATGQTGPSTGTRTLNGLNVFEWTSNNCLERVGFTHNQSTTPLNVAMIMQVDTTAATQLFFLAGTTSVTAGQRMSCRITTSNSWEIIGGSNAGANQQMGGGAAVKDQPYILIPKFNGATSAWRVNGTQTNTGNIGTNPFTILSWGHAENEGQDLDGYLAEMIGFSDNTKQEIVEGYLAWKWGLVGKLPAGHPYKNSAP